MVVTATEKVLICAMTCCDDDDGGDDDDDDDDDGDHDRLVGFEHSSILSLEMACLGYPT